jgi:hypothetical protein
MRVSRVVIAVGVFERCWRCNLFGTGAHRSPNYFVLARLGELKRSGGPRDEADSTGVTSNFGRNGSPDPPIFDQHCLIIDTYQESESNMYSLMRFEVSNQARECVTCAHSP